MPAHDFSEFSWDEQEDVKAVLASRGLAPGEFKITDNHGFPQHGADETVRQISVTRLSNGKQATYDTDHFAPWLTDFDEALAAGYFDD